jgi:TetR/AcrR family transcriptional repressor of nem operon
MRDTRTKILDVAQDLIQQVGLNAMSYKHISEAVGVRKASIHHHFPKKENLVDELLNRCHLSYGSRYQEIIEGTGSAPEKLRQLADVYADGLQKSQLCVIGTISADLNTLQSSSCQLLEETIQNTVEIFSAAFRQGREEGSLSFSGSEEETAYAYFSFLLGAQIAARAHGGFASFRTATEVTVSAWER